MYWLVFCGYNYYTIKKLQNGGSMVKDKTMKIRIDGNTRWALRWLASKKKTSVSKLIRRGITLVFRENNDIMITMGDIQT